jgi:hypothetical protein
MKALYVGVMAVALLAGIAFSRSTHGTVVALQSSGAAATVNHESPFACDRLALTPELRKRHFDELGPTLRSLRKNTRELPNGFEFEYPADASTIQLVAEWAAGERACCPFFDIDLRMERERGSFWLRLTGRDGVKQFIQSDFARWFKK